ncbi:MAG: repeat protein [Phycisphaerales bacterium]|nr:repeat protein [Phycisphaerales bacterium]
MRASLSIAFATLALAMSLARDAGAQPARQRGPMPPMDPETAALLKQTLADARALAASSLPDRARLGADWKTAWEVPPTSGARVASEDEYWDKVGKNLGFAGMDEAKARRFIDELLAQFSPMAAAQGMTPRDAIQSLFIKVHSDNAPTAMKSVETWENAARTFRVAEQMEGNPDRRKAGPRAVLDVIGEPYKAFTDDQLKEMFVKTASLAQKRTEMTYYLCNNWPGLAAAKTDEELARNGIWLGMIKISLMLADPYKTAEPIDLNKDDAPALQSRLLSAVTEASTRGMAMQRKRLEAQMEAYRARGDNAAAERVQKQLRTEQTSASSLNAKVDMLTYGDNSYAVRITGVSPDTVGMQFGLFSGWVRKGPAMAEVSVGGNMPREQMDIAMKKALDELDAKLDSYDSSMFAKLDVKAGAPTTPAPLTPSVNPPATPPVSPPVSPRAAPPPPVTPPVAPPVAPPLAPPAIDGAITPVPPPGGLPAGLSPAGAEQQQAGRIAPPPPAIDPPELAQGVAAYQTRDFKTAVQQFDQGLRQSPNNPRLLMMRASAKHQQNDLAGALADFRAAAEASPNDPQLRRYWALAELLAGKAKTSYEQAQAAMKLAPGDAEGMLVGAQAAMATNHADEARQLFAAVLRATPQRAQALHAEATNAYNLVSYLEASFQFDTVLELDPNMYQAHYGRAAALAARGKNRNAIAAYQEYLKHDQASSFAMQAQAEIDRLRRLK